jgi:anti-sigma factor RsiW
VTRLRHRRLRRSVDALVDGELDVAWAAVVEQHVRTCWECSAAADAARLIKRSLRRRAEREPTSLATARLLRYSDRLLAS